MTLSGIERPEDPDARISEQTRERLEAQEPSEEEKRDLREEHEGHLVRDTTSKLSIDADVGPGMEAEIKAEIPDLYCFTCEEWIGLSGVELRGTPRSKADAYYLGGMPLDVLHAKNGVAKTLNELAGRLEDRVDNVTGREDALEFIETELEAMPKSSEEDDETADRASTGMKQGGRDE